MSQRTNEIAAVTAIILLGVGFFLIGTGLITFFSPRPTTTATRPPTTSTTLPPTTTTTIIEESKTLSVLTRLDVSIQNVFETAFLGSPFAVEHRITDIRWTAASASFWDDLIDVGVVDVCWGGGSSLFDELLQGNRLSALISSEMQDVASRVNDTIAGCAMKRNNAADELAWIGTRLSTYGFTINHHFLDNHSLPAPNSWQNLSAPIYGKYLPFAPTIAMANAPDSLTHYRIYDLILQMMGWDSGWIHLTRMVGNSRMYGGAVEAQISVESGEIGISLCSDLFGLYSQESTPNCEYIVPLDGTIVEGDPIAIAATSPQKSLAEGFIDFVLSPYGQSLFLMPPLQLLPVMDEAFDEPGVIGAEGLYRVFNETIRCISFEMNQTQSLVTQMSVVDYFESVMTDSHTELSSCWKVMVDAFLAENITSSELDSYAVAMGTPVSIVDPISTAIEKFTLEYAIRINENMTYDVTYRNTVKSRWTDEAKTQYVTVQSNLESLYPWLEFHTTSGLPFIEASQVTALVFLGFGGFGTIRFIRKRLE